MLLYVVRNRRDCASINLENPGTQQDLLNRVGAKCCLSLWRLWSAMVDECLDGAVHHRGIPFAGYQRMMYYQTVRQTTDTPLIDKCLVTAAMVNATAMVIDAA